MKKEVIYKYELAVTDTQEIKLPIGSKILTVQSQHEQPRLWALVNPHAETEVRVIEIFGTGHPILSDMGSSREYIATFQQMGGDLVFHVFEYTGV